MILKINDDLELRQLGKDDAACLFKLVDQNRAHLMTFMPWVDITQEQKDTLFFIEQTLRQYDQKKEYHFGIWKGDTLVGLCGYNNVNQANDRGALGYWLSKEFSGKGYMTLACQRLIKFGFEELSLNKIIIECAPQNKQSAAVAKRLGFKQEGVLRQMEKVNDRYLDHIHFGLLKPEWKS